MRTRSVPGYSKIAKAPLSLSAEHTGRVVWNLLVHSTSPSVDLDLFENLTLEHLVQISIDLLNVTDLSATARYFVGHVASEYEYVTGDVLRCTTVLSEDQRERLSAVDQRPILAPQQFVLLLWEWKRAAKRVAEKIQEIG